MASFTFDVTPAALAFAALIFGLRVLNYSIGTVRLVLIGRGMKIFASVLAFLEAFIFTVVMAQVITNLSNITNLLAYCLGAAVGSYTGMWLETRFIVSYSTVTVISHEKGQEIVAAIRNNNYGATLSKGEGREGEGDIIRSSAINRDIPKLIEIVRGVHASAFIDVEAVRTVRRGWLPGGPAHRA